MKEEIEMNKELAKKHNNLKIRIPMYFFGLFLMTIGIAVSVKSADDADMAVSRIEHKVSRLGIAPSDGSAVFVLHGCSTTMTDNITAARLVVKHPIDK